MDADALQCKIEREQKAQGPHRSPVQTKAMDSFEYKNEFKISRNLSIVYLDFKK